MNLKVNNFSNQFRTAFFVFCLLTTVAVFFLFVYWFIDHLITLYQNIDNQSYASKYKEL